MNCEIDKIAKAFIKPRNAKLAQAILQAIAEGRLTADDFKVDVGKCAAWHKGGLCSCNQISYRLGSYEKRFLLTYNFFDPEVNSEWHESSMVMFLSGELICQDYNNRQCEKLCNKIKAMKEEQAALAKEAV